VPLGPPNRDPDEDLRQLATHIREVVVDNNSALSSVGLVDWTSVYHVDELFEGGDRDLGPFVALADLNAIIAAVLFYDRVVVLDADDLVPRVAEALRVPDVLVSLSSKAGPSGAGGHRLLKPSTSWLLRITRPRLWFLARATAAGQRLVEPQFKLASLFALPPGDKAHGLDFLSRVNAVEWAI
jgi:hypothetical protein